MYAPILIAWQSKHSELPTQKCFPVVAPLFEAPLASHCKPVIKSDFVNTKGDIVCSVWSFSKYSFERAVRTRLTENSENQSNI